MRGILFQIWLSLLVGMTQSGEVIWAQGGPSNPSDHSDRPSGSPSNTPSGSPSLRSPSSGSIGMPGQSGFSPPFPPPPNDPGAGVDNGNTPGPKPFILDEIFREKSLIPPGFTGRSGILPTEGPSPDGHFVPVEDRWRVGFPEWDRGGKDHPWYQEYTYDLGQWWDPYRQNILKADYPIFGQNTFLDLTITSFTIIQPSTVPSQTTPFESTARPYTDNFFGNPNQLGTQQFISMGIDLFHGDTSFRPVDWRFKLTPIFNANVLSTEELAQVNPNIRRGTQRERTYMALEEWFLEKKIADWGPDYDFTSVRVGSQFFNSDFRGLVFNNINRGARLFGSLNSNQDQYNLIYFNMMEKDTNSGLNTFDNRNQQVAVANWFRQDFLYPGYTMQGSFHYNHDDPTFLFNNNNFLVRPDPVGVYQPHTLDVFYLGVAGDGHIDRINVNHALYTALGSDTRNPLANQAQSITAFMGALELSYDRDYTRFRASFFYASGDGNPNNSHATGFDSIFDRQNFAGSFFSWWGRNRLPLFGVGLKQEFSLLPDLRSSKTQGQSNFVNPGIQLFGLGVDIDVTPKLKVVNNMNFMWFDKTAALETFVYQGQIARQIGTDLSVGLEYRPTLSNNVQFATGVNTLVPGDGFKDLYNNFGTTAPSLVSAFLQMTVQY